MVETLFQSLAVPEHVAVLTTDASSPRGPGPLAALIVLISAVAGMLVVSLIINHRTNPILAILAPQLVLLCVVISAILLGRWQPAACGMRWPRSSHFLIGIAILPMVIGIALGAQHLVMVALGAPPDNIKEIDRALTTIYTTGGWGLVILLTCVLPGIVEELLMRGLVLSGLRRVWPPWVAIVGTALLFAAMHGSLWRFAPQLTLGIAVGWLAVRSGSCWPGALCHALYNAVAIALVLASQKLT